MMIPCTGVEQNKNEHKLGVPYPNLTLFRIIIAAEIPLIITFLAANLI